MAKTEMTRNIEASLRDYRPAKICGIKINKLRKKITAFEVPAENGTTMSGLIDCVSIQEYFGDIKRVGICITRGWKKEGVRNILIKCPRGFINNEETPERCEESGCNLNRAAKMGTPKILIIAYEIKVSKSDFKSTHGHNFVGNCNYYVIPKELFAEVKDLVPDNIGIILYLNGSLRRKKECVFKDLTDHDQKWLILSAMKRREHEFLEMLRKELEKPDISCQEFWN